jgi:hypothetical protein
MNEEWKDIPELNGDYQVSNLGRIRRAKECKGKGCNTTHVGRIVKTEYSSKGYERIRMKWRGFSQYVHRTVANAFLPNPNNLPHVHHINHIKTDNRLSNLMWATIEENNDHNITLTVNSLIQLLDSTTTYTKQNIIDIVSRYR